MDQGTVATPLQAVIKPKFGEWQDIATAPKTTRAILVWVPENKCTYAVTWAKGEVTGWQIFGGGWRAVLNGERPSQGPSHWMPLPDPPEA